MQEPRLLSRYQKLSGIHLKKPLRQRFASVYQPFKDLDIPTRVTALRFMYDLYVTVKDNRQLPYYLMHRLYPRKMPLSLKELCAELPVKIVYRTVL